MTARAKWTMMKSGPICRVGSVSYRFGRGPQPSDFPDHRLAEIVEGSVPGRALDLGCGTGRNALYLARNGWETTGVEFSEGAVAVAQQKAEAGDLRVRFVHGDVTKLCELGIGEGYSLLMDGGCYHMIPVWQRDAYVDSVTKVTAPGGLLIMVGFTKYLGMGMSEKDLVARFRGWRLIDASPVPGDQMREYISRPALFRAPLGWGLFSPFRYQLERLSAAN